MEELLNKTSFEELVQLYTEAEYFTLYGQLNEDASLRALTRYVYSNDLAVSIVLTSSTLYRYLLNQFINKVIQIEDFQEALNEL